MLKIVLYYRKSTDDSKRQKASIEDQKAWAHEYLKNINEPYEIIAEYEEKKSAKKPWRPLFNEMMGLIYEWKVDTIIAWAVDRLSRNEIDEWTIKWAVREWKLTKIITKEATYTENELFTMWIFLSMSAEEIANFRKRVVRRMTAMVEKEWKVPFHAPLGYKNIGEWYVEINPEEKPIVEKIFKLRVAGNSFQQIADILNAEWLPTRRRNYPWSKMQWTKRLVEHVVKNEFYIGVVKFMDVIGEGIFERFITRDIFDEANNRKRLNIGYNHHEFLLKGLIVWPDGEPLTASKIKGKYVYYHNNWWKIKISENEIFKQVGKIIEKWIIPDDIMQKIEQYIHDSLFQEMRAILSEKAIYEKQLKNLDQQDFNLAKFLSMGKISIEMFDAQKIELIKEKTKIIEKLQAFSAIGMADLEKFQKIIELVRNLIGTYKTADSITKGAIIRASIIELQVGADKSLKIKEKEPFYWLSLLNVPFGAGNGTRTHNGRHGKAVL